MTPNSAQLTPKHLTKQEFGKRVYELMLKRDWRQSDLARHSGLKRDAISTYVTGRSLPTPQNLEALARAFGVKPEALLPNYIEGAIEADFPAVEIKASANAPNKAWLRVNRLVSFNTAVKIVELINNDDAVD